MFKVTSGRSGQRTLSLITMLLIITAGIAGLTRPVTATGSITEYNVPVPGEASFLTAGPDGAVWYTKLTNNMIGRITLDGTVTEYPIPTASSAPGPIEPGPDGALWFAEGAGNKIGRITPAGAITEYQIPTAVDVKIQGRTVSSSYPIGIVAGPDGAIWFTEQAGNKIGRLSLDGTFAEYPVLTAKSDPLGITVGPDSALWFIERIGNKVGRITTSGIVTEYPIPSADSFPNRIVTGLDGALWFTEYRSNKIGRITTAGQITEFAVPSAVDVKHPLFGLIHTSGSVGITAGPDGALWFAESNANNIGRITTDGSIAEFTVPTPDSAPFQITTGPDKALWFTEVAAKKIGRLQLSSVPGAMPNTGEGGGGDDQDRRTLDSNDQ